MASTTYRALITRPVLSWAAVAVAARMPVAMAPLALVFLVRERPGGYVLGAELAAVYVVGEVIGAALLGARLRPDRARRHLAGGLGAGAVAFAGLGILPGAPDLVLGAFALLAGAAPAASPGGLRALLTEHVDTGLVPKALSAEATLTYAVWAAAPAAAGGLAFGVASYAPLLLAAALMALSVAGLWALPGSWEADESDRAGVSVIRTLATAWPVYVSGAAAMSLLALAELVLPALLEQRGLAVSWSGPLLAGYSLAAAAGALLYGLRSWPGRLSTQSLVLLLGVSACVAAAAVIPSLAAVAVALVVAGLLQAGLQVTRALGLRAVLPQSALAAGYSMMYSAVGVGYAASASLSGAVLSIALPSTAILSGVVLTLLLTVASAVGEVRLVRAKAYAPAEQ
ncbi:MFS transporter [Streptomyces inhibens]|uniref:MFS transporter n=1 Tax=Streptomyces inhibens TaxID=2293571 RepID=A0A371PX06_STRIH|nr:MFS transporter [Streptomyces inhibens]REK87020.1 MFS transporter [Streptomyces inhibens]